MAFVNGRYFAQRRRSRTQTKPDANENGRIGFRKRRTRKSAMKRLAVTGRFIAKRDICPNARAKGSKARKFGNRGEAAVCRLERTLCELDHLSRTGSRIDMRVPAGLAGWRTGPGRTSRLAPQPAAPARAAGEMLSCWRRLPARSATTRRRSATGAGISLPLRASC